MKPFLKNNWFKIALIIIFLFCIMLVYSYETKQQKLQEQQHLSNLTSVCQKLAVQKKVDITSSDNNLYLSLYEFKYNPEYQSCIVVYTGTYTEGGFVNLFGHNLFAVDNLTTGQSIFNKRVDPGDEYHQTNIEFNQMRNQYIGSTTPIK